MRIRKPYPSDLSDTQWQRLAPLIPAAEPGGRPREHDPRELCNAIFYVTRAWGDWRMLPHDFPPWPTVYSYFRRWQRDGTWERALDVLRGQVRRAAGRDTQPSAGIIDASR